MASPAQERYCGKTEAVASYYAALDGLQVQIAVRDGVCFACVREGLVPDRVNFYIRDGFVYDAEIG